MSLEADVVAEFGKVKGVLRKLVSAVSIGSETELTSLTNDLEAIAEPEPPAEEAAPVAAAPGADPLAGYSVEQLQAELSARQGANA